MKLWFPLLFPTVLVALVALTFALVWWLPVSPQAVSIIAICRDGTPIYRRPDGSHYARKGFDRYDVPNPETVCR